MTAANQVLPYVHTLWCDDIRNELGNKHSFMGAYGGDIVVAELPITLPRLACFTWVVLPMESPAKLLHVRLVLDGTVLVEQPAQELPGLPMSDAAVSDNYARKTIALGLMVAPVELPVGSKYLQVLLELDGAPMGSNRLLVRVDPALVARGGRPAEAAAEIAPEA